MAPDLPSGPDFNKQQTVVVSEDRGRELQMPQQDVHGPSSDFHTSQDYVSGITKIVPSDFDVSMTKFEIYAL